LPTDQDLDAAPNRPEHAVPYMIPQQPRTIHTTDPDPTAAGVVVTVNEAEHGYACLWVDHTPADGLLFLDATARRELAAALVSGLA
jgi:hypothetical protein